MPGEQRPHRVFAARLKQILIDAGYGTSRSPLGVSVDKLCDITQSSRQNCRRYLRGEALPSYDNTLKIAAALRTNPGWLLFGAQHRPVIHNTQMIAVNKSVLFRVLLHLDQLSDQNMPTMAIGLMLEWVEALSMLDDEGDNFEKMIALLVSSYVRGK